MSRFSARLREIHEKIDLPQPLKSRILLEIASDMNDTYEELRRRGLGEEEAARRAGETFDLSDETIAELAAVHRSPLRSLAEMIAARTRSPWERGALLAVLLFIVLVAAREAGSFRLIREASAWVWPVAGLTLAGAAVGAARFWALFLRADHEPARLRRGLPTLLVLAGTNLFLGAYGFAFDMYRALGVAAHDAGAAPVAVVIGLLRGLPTLIVALVTAIGLALVWYLLDDKAARVEQAEAESLFAG